MNSDPVQHPPMYHRTSNERVARLRSEVADLLTSHNSPARQLPEFENSITQCDRLQAQIDQLNSSCQQMLEFLEKIKQAEEAVETAKRELAAETLEIGGFAQELGSKAFAGLEAGNLSKHPRFENRQQLQDKIRELENRREEIVSETTSGVLEKGKQQSRRAKVAALIKIEKLKINKQEKSLGQAILHAGDEEDVFCRETEETIERVVAQRGQIASAKEKSWNLEQALAGLLTNTNQTLNLTAINDSDALKVQSEARREQANSVKQQLFYERENLVTAVMKSPYALEDDFIRDKLSVLNRMLAESDLQAVQNSPNRSNDKPDFWKGLSVLGGLILAVGVLITISAMAMDTTVGTDDGSRIHNIGLQQDRMMLLFGGLFTIVFGGGAVAVDILRKK